LGQKSFSAAMVFAVPGCFAPSVTERAGGVVMAQADSRVVFVAE
jgi:hypothetical protein